MPHAVAKDRVRLHYEEAGSGTPIIFLHEFAADHTNWEPQMRYFSRGHRCIAYSARGYTPSDVPADAAVYTYKHFYTDALRSYDRMGERGYVHSVIDDAEEYVDGAVHTDGLENFWSLLKRALKGAYVSVEPFHLFRYLDEQAFRFNNRKGTDAMRFALALKGIINKRLTYTALTGSEVPQTA